ncbi:hypothetical protein BT93_L4851 [Corymbia citriodora subsp. variegata]|uniref:Uncharacterized protein n=1 Tax=Corymbia citriodora subsp. variegata TaxID=360336 RepID=A0A8T0CTW9_CORYI|nr:hypothetical protein BT93_L4851 [Corymbia citriodora subsp. variegata]
MFPFRVSPVDFSHWIKKISRRTPLDRAGQINCTHGASGAANNFSSLHLSEAANCNIPTTHAPTRVRPTPRHPNLPSPTVPPRDPKGASPGTDEIPTVRHSPLAGSDGWEPVAAPRRNPFPGKKKKKRKKGHLLWNGRSTNRGAPRVRAPFPHSPPTLS